jgi:hypothetical protein
MNGSAKACRVDPSWRHESPRKGKSPPMKNGLNPHSDEAQARTNASNVPAGSSYRLLRARANLDENRSPSSYEYTHGAVNDPTEPSPPPLRAARGITMACWGEPLTLDLISQGPSPCQVKTRRLSSRQFVHFLEVIPRNGPGSAAREARPNRTLAGARRQQSVRRRSAARASNKSSRPSPLVGLFARSALRPSPVRRRRHILSRVRPNGGPIARRLSLD